VQTLDRRGLIALALGFAARGRAAAQDDERAQTRREWPTRAVRILVAYPPGGVSDAIARELASLLAHQSGFPVVVENRAGASGTLAMEQLARSSPDGHFLCFGAATAVTLLAATKHLPTGTLPVAPVAGVMRTPVLVVGTTALRANSFGEMLEVARTQPGGVRWATTGVGTTGHMVLERVRRASGAPLLHIPYKGGAQQITDALGGHFEVLSTNVAPQQLEAIHRGHLTALAVGAPESLAVLPSIPTLAELGFPQANLNSLFGLFAPPGISPANVVGIHGQVALALRSTGLRNRLLAAHNMPFTGGPAEFAAQVLRESQR
jgi:tripartite-type tricarboxylate transporter receptor subunit TctC